MILEKDLKDLIEKVMKELSKENEDEKITQEIETQDCKCEEVKDECKCECEDISDDELEDITAQQMQNIFYVPNPQNKEEYMKLKQTTPARVGIWRAGPRYNTKTAIRFRADHAVAQDAVFSDVSEEFLQEMGVLTVQTMCSSKDEYLTRPDLGRKFDEESIKIIKEHCKNKPTVQIYFSDGLSSTAIESNVKNTLPAIMEGLKDYGIDVGTPFFVKYGRVGAMDVIGEALGAEVTCVLIGERPGLATGESMSCYMVYKTYEGIPEAKRTVVSNIHKHGTPSAEAGAHIASIVKKMLEEKASGIDLKL